MCFAALGHTGSKIYEITIDKAESSFEEERTQQKAPQPISAANQDPVVSNE